MQYRQELMLATRSRTSTAVADGSRSFLSSLEILP